MEKLFDPGFYAPFLFDDSFSYVALFIIVSIGFLVGNLEVKGFSLGVSAILFVAMIFGHFGVRLPMIIQNIGLVLFLFTVGLQAGPAFFDSLKKHGKNLAIMASVGVLAGLIITIICAKVFGFNMAMAAGLMGGALTSTPGLATAAELFPAGDVSIAYGISYPFGVIGVILFLRLLPRILKIDLGKSEKEYTDSLMVDHPEVRAEHLIVNNDNIEGKTLSQMQFRTMTQAVVSRVKHGDDAFTPARETVLHKGDIVRVVGTEDALLRARVLMGETTDEVIELSNRYDVQTILVTNREVVNKTILQVNLHAVYNATITRIRRSGIDITPEPHTRIRFGDKLIVACDVENMRQVTNMFGNDARRLSDTDFLPIAVGIVLGVLVGKLTPLGLTGGVLCVALVLGRLGKTGPILWTLSGSANMLLRELGLIFFLAVVGTKAGETLVNSFVEYGPSLFLAGALITLIPMILMAWVALKWQKMNFLSMLGGLSGGMTSTPGLAVLSPMTRTNAPQTAYATVYPLAMVLLVVAVRILALF